MPWYIPVTILLHQLCCTLTDMIKAGQKMASCISFCSSPHDRHQRGILLLTTLFQKTPRTPISPSAGRDHTVQLSAPVQTTQGFLVSAGGYLHRLPPGHQVDHMALSNGAVVTLLQQPGSELRPERGAQVVRCCLYGPSVRLRWNHVTSIRSLNSI